ncbi:MAG TPA: methyltransferase domain-containing protein [Jatrophihabitantaceae bacterium]|jgi:SAM-dependent methyltransferase
MTYVIDWAAQAAAVPSEAGIDAAWNAAVAREIGRTTDRFVVDAGCGSGGMARALADALPEARVVGVDASEHMLELAAARSAGYPRIEFVQASYEDGLADAVGQPADLVWASASVHHAGDQQAAVTRLAELLAPGGRLALAEGGLPAYYLPWDVGVGEPGLEHRLVAAGQRWFERMRAALPGQVRMPYGWPEAMRRAGLADGRTRTFLTEVPAPLPAEAREVVVHALTAQVERLADTELLDEADRDTWRHLLDPDDAAWVGARDDTYVLSARSVHTGYRRSTT